MGDFSLDFSEVEALAASLGTADSRLPRAVRAVVSKGALNVKKDAQANVSGHPSWRHLSSTINYETSGNAYFSEAKVGYDDVGQGELAGIYEFGSSRHAPHPTLLPALASEAPAFEKALGDVAAKIIGDAL